LFKKQTNKRVHVIYIPSALKKAFALAQNGKNKNIHHQDKQSLSTK
jgi:hypothetical protein